MAVNLATTGAAMLYFEPDLGNIGATSSPMGSTTAMFPAAKLGATLARVG